MVPMAKLCECGCGHPTKIAEKSDRRFGWVAGEPRRFLAGHHRNQARGTECANWNGGQMMNDEGYRLLLRHGHPRANNNGYVREHILVAERALGKHLPDGAEIHHVNRDRADNRNENLVVCEDHGYHRLLHRRQRAFEECGHPDWRQCRYCRGWDGPEKLYIRGGQARHRKCHAQAEARRVLSARCGAPVGTLRDWAETGIRYHGHTDRLEAYTEEALHEFIRRCPHHLAIIGAVDPRVWRDALCEASAGYPAVPQEAA